MTKWDMADKKLSKVNPWIASRKWSDQKCLTKFLDLICTFRPLCMGSLIIGGN